MSSLGGNAPLTLRAFPQALMTAARAAVYAAAAGAAEAAYRLATDPLLYDSRIDALTFAAGTTAFAAALGLAVGFAASFALAPRWGLVAASFWPAALGVSAWGFANVPGPWEGTRWGAVAAVVAGMTAATLVVAIASALTPADGLVLGPRERTRRRLLMLPVFVPVVVLAWMGGRILIDRRTPPADAPSLLLVTVDTLRADALGAFRQGRSLPPGLEAARTPALDAFAEKSFVFTEASTTIPKTPQAVATLMTGTYPAEHGLTDLFRGLNRTNDTLAEMLRRRGWATRAVVTNLLIGRESGIAQGFDMYWDKDGLRPQFKRLAVLDLAARIWSAPVTWLLNRSAELRIGDETATETTDRAIRTLGRAESRPYFLWVHYLDPHWIYWAPEPYRSETDTEPGLAPDVYDAVRTGRARIGEVIHRNTMKAEEISRINSLYAGEVTYVDHEVGRLLDRALGGPRGSSTVVIFTADHGESLGEHDYYFSHGDLVHEASMRVPLLIRSAGEDRGRAIGTPASLVDIVPTALELLGTHIPAEISGRSLTRSMSFDLGEIGEGPRRPIFGESDLSYLAEDPYLTIPGEAGKMRFIREGRYKLVRTPHDVEAARLLDPELGEETHGLENAFGFAEATKLGPSRPDEISLFDLSVDPGETADISADEPEVTQALVRTLNEWLAGTVRMEAGSRQAGEELLDTLKSLGYVDSGGGN